MSNSSALALIIGSALPGAFVYVYIGRWAHAVAAEIVSGLVQSVPVPTRWRWLMLYNQWLPMQAAGTAVSAIVGLVNLRIAGLSEDPGVTAIGHLVAFVAALVAIGWVLMGATDFVFLRGEVRQAEAAPTFQSTPH